MRPLLVAIGSAVLIVAPAATPVRAREATGKAVVVTIDGTTLAEWDSPSLPSLGALLRSGAVGIMSTRTDSEETDAVRIREAAYRTLGGGARGGARSAGDLAAALQSAGIRIAAILAERPDPTFPTGSRTDYAALQRAVTAGLRDAGVLIVDTADTARVERVFGPDQASRRRWIGLALSRADAFLGWLREQLGPGDLLIVASVTAPVARLEQRWFLAPVLAFGAGERPGILTSPTTRRAGIVSLTDLAPTILERLGVPPPRTMTGRPIDVVPAEDAPSRLRAREEEILHAAAVRSPLLRGTLGAAIALVVLSLLTVVSGRGRPPPRGRLPRGWRGLLQAALLALSAAPLALLLEPLSRARSTGTSVAFVAGLGVALALIARATIGAHRGLGVILGSTLFVGLFDLVSGGPLAHRSPLSFLVAEGVRFHGIGNEWMGVLIGCALFAGVWTLDRSPSPARALRPVAASLALTAGLMAAPPVGAKLGATLTALPAFGVFALRAAGRRLDRTAVLALAIATVLATDLVVAWDALRSPETQSHIARAVGDPAGGIAGRKLGAALGLLALSIWAQALIVCVGAVLLLAWRRRLLVGRAFWGRPALRAALAAAGVGAAGSIAFNDAGVIAAALIAMLGAAQFFTVLLAPEER